MTKKTFAVTFEISHTVEFVMKNQWFSDKEFNVLVDGVLVVQRRYAFFDVSIQEKTVFYVEDKECALVTNYLVGAWTVQLYIDGKPYL
jgi:hypothetical protein